MTLKSTFIAVKANTKKYGIKNSLIRLIKFLLRVIGIHYEQYLYCIRYIYVDKLKNFKTNVNGDIKELRIENLIDNRSEFKFSDSKIELFKQRLLDENIKGFGYFIDNKLVYTTWISLSKFEKHGSKANLRLDSTEGLLFDSYCLPSYRNYGIHAFMNVFRLRKLLEYNRNKAVVMLLKENIPARKTQKKSGFICEQIITYFSVGKWHKVFVIKKQIEL